MESKYIFAIVTVGLFCFMVLIYFALLAHKRTLDARLDEWLYKVYISNKLIKTDYDVVSAEADALIQSARASQEEQAMRESVEEDVQLSLQDAYGKIEVEGIEEITGNYIGDW